MPYLSRHITYDISYPILAASSTYKGDKQRAAGVQECQNWCTAGTPRKPFGIDMVLDELTDLGKKTEIFKYN